MKKILGLLILFLFIHTPQGVLGKDTDIYVLASTESQIYPDALMVLDFSGSMRWTPAGEKMYISSSQSCGYDVAYYSNPDPTHSKPCSIDPYGTVPKYSDATCSGPFYKYSGSEHTTECSRLAIAKRAVQNVLDSNDDGTIDTEDETHLGIRFGYMRFRDGDDTGGNYNSGNIRLIKGLNSTFSEIMSSINSEGANSGTPLSSSLNEARLYLNNHKTSDPAKDCRLKFVILVTDGADTYACSGSGDESQQSQYKRRRWTVARAKALNDAGYRVYVVGFGSAMPHFLRNTLNWAAFYGGTKNPLDTQSGDTTAFNPALNTSCQTSSTSHHDIEGDGDHYFATSNDPGEKPLTGYAFLASDADQLSNALKTIAEYIVSLNKKSVSYVAPVVPVSQFEKGYAGNRLYIGMFKPSDKSFWKGNIKKFGIAEADVNDIKIGDILDKNGSLAIDEISNIKSTSVSYWGTTADGDNVEKGGVGELLKNRDFNTDPRKIYSYLGTNTTLTDSSNAFTLLNAGITPQKLGLDPSDTVGRDRIINFIHGLDAYDWEGPIGPDGFPGPGPDGVTNVKRSWILGAIIHSRPLVIHYGIDQSVIYAGANDGMFHAFEEATGKELWAFIPPNLLPFLKKLNGTLLEFFVDGSPKAYVEKDDSGNLLKAIIIFGQRRGGNRYIALDVTDRLSPKLLWEIGPEVSGFSELGQTWSHPQIVKIKNGTSGKWVAFFGGGYDENQDNIPVLNPDSKGRGIFCLDILTGNLIWKYTNYENSSGMLYSIPSNISCVDTDGDDYADRLYVGDLGGRVWRFDIGDYSNTNAWTGKIIFNTNKKIFHCPDVTLENDAGYYEMVFLGTGDRENPRGTSDINMLYAIKDFNPTSILTESDLVDVTDDLLQDPNTSSSQKAAIQNELKTKKGWYIRLNEKSGEKCLSSPVVFYGGVYYTTYAPAFEGVDVCHLGGGQGNIYIVNYKTGNATLNLDPTNDLDEALIMRSDRKKVIGAAIPSDTIISVVAGKAVGYVGVGGGIYIAEIINRRPIIPLNWRIVF